jgi:hypothetical protein
MQYTSHTCAEHPVTVYGRRAGGVQGSMSTGSETDLLAKLEPTQKLKAQAAEAYAAGT